LNPTNSIHVVYKVMKDYLVPF